MTLQLCSVESSSLSWARAHFVRSDDQIVGFIQAVEQICHDLTDHLILDKDARAWSSKVSDAAR